MTPDELVKNMLEDDAGHIEVFVDRGMVVAQAREGEFGESRGGLIAAATGATLEDALAALRRNL